MTTELRNRITVKMFIGALVGADLRLLLDKSHLWKDYQITKSKRSDPLTEVTYKNKSYIGFFTDEHGATMTEIREVEDRLKGWVKDQCPDFNGDALKVFIFPQVFIS